MAGWQVLEAGTTRLRLGSWLVSDGMLKVFSTQLLHQPIVDASSRRGLEGLLYRTSLVPMRFPPEPTKAVVAAGSVWHARCSISLHEGDAGQSLKTTCGCSMLGASPAARSTACMLSDTTQT